ncbi:MAG: hypothetical protein P8010_21785 [Desulfosarcinaceae bacterium]
MFESIFGPPVQSIQISGGENGHTAPTVIQKKPPVSYSLKNFPQELHLVGKTKRVYDQFRKPLQSTGDRHWA